MAFDVRSHITVLEKKYKTKDNGVERWNTRQVDYLPVQWRLVWFREECKEGTIETELVHVDYEVRRAVFKATVSDGKGAFATGYKIAVATPQFSDFLEKAETGAVGRALAGLGYGAQFAPEFDEEDGQIIEETSSTPPPMPIASASPVVVSAPSAKALENRCERLFGAGKWATLKVRHLGANSNDDSLTPEQCMQLKVAMDTAEQRARQQKQAS